MKILFKYNRYYFKTLILFVLVLIGLKVLISDINMTFIELYTAAFIGFYSINLIEFSFQDKGMTYLLTLPIKKEQYVGSNYLNILVSIIIMGVVSLILNVVNKVDNSLISVLYLISMPLVLTGINLPVKLYIGSGFGAAYAFSGFLSSILVIIFIPLSIFLADNFSLAMIVFTFSSICYIVSYFASLKIFENKEF